MVSYLHPLQRRLPMAAATPACITAGSTLVVITEADHVA